MLGWRPIASSTWLPISSGAPSSQLTPTATPVAVRREADALGAGAHRDAFGGEDLADRLGDVGVLVGDQARTLLDHGDGGAEAAEGLGELEADVAAADDDQVLGQGVEGEQRAVGQRGDPVDAGQVRHRGAGADVEEDAPGGERAVADRDACAGRSGGRGRGSG